MSVSFAILLALSASVPPPPDSAMRQHTRRAIMALNTGHALAIASFWTLPVILDAGIVTMMGAKKTLKNEYRMRYNEDPEVFGETGDDAYWKGWAMKGGAVASIFVVSGLTEQPGLAIISFGILWLGGTIKHYEASRMLYEQSRHFENGILDENPPELGKAQGDNRENGDAFKLRLALDF